MHMRSGAQRPDHAHHTTSGFVPAASSSFVHNSTQTLVGVSGEGGFCKSPLRYPSFGAPAGVPAGPPSGAASMEFEPWLNWAPQPTQHVHHVGRSGAPRGPGAPAPRPPYLPVDLDSAAFHLKVHHPGVHLVQPPGEGGAPPPGGPAGPPRQDSADREDSPMMGVCVQQSPVVSH